MSFWSNFFGKMPQKLCYSTRNFLILLSICWSSSNDENFMFRFQSYESIRNGNCAKWKMSFGQMENHIFYISSLVSIKHPRYFHLPSYSATVADEIEHLIQIFPHDNAFFEYEASWRGHSRWISTQIKWNVIFLVDL